MNNRVVRHALLFILGYAVVLGLCGVLDGRLPLPAAVKESKIAQSLPSPGFTKSYVDRLKSKYEFLFDAPLRDMPLEERRQLLIEENAWKNTYVTWALPQWLLDNTSHTVQTWLRCMIFAGTVYLVTGGLWCYYVYVCFGDKLFKAGGIPALSDIWEQIKVSGLAMPMYSMLPTITEYLAEQGWTMAYPRIANIGLFWYCVYFVLYMVSVEFGIYWNHRLLHEIEWAYKHLHQPHHKYNKQHTLSPYAGLAFHPLDGIMQAIPYAWTLFFCPMHFLTSELLLFATGLWTTNIHDCLHGKVWPVMGAGYHLIHHITYKHNYGQFLTYMDWMFGTLETPEEHALRKSAVKAPKTS